MCRDTKQLYVELTDQWLFDADNIRIGCLCDEFPEDHEKDDTRTNWWHPSVAIAEWNDMNNPAYPPIWERE